MDILLLILLAVGFVAGLVSGAVRQLISLVAFVAGFAVACLYYRQLGELLTGFLPTASFCRVLAFALLWVVVPVVASLIARLLTSALNVVPVLGTLNRVLGGMLGLAKYALVLGALVWLFSSMKLIKEETMQQSRLCRPLKAVPEYIYNVLKNLNQEGQETAHVMSANATRGIGQRHT